MADKTCWESFKVEGKNVVAEFSGRKAPGGSVRRARLRPRALHLERNGSSIARGEEPVAPGRM